MTRKIYEDCMEKQKNKGPAKFSIADKIIKNRNVRDYGPDKNERRM